MTLVPEIRIGKETYQRDVHLGKETYKADLHLRSSLSAHVRSRSLSSHMRRTVALLQQTQKKHETDLHLRWVSFSPCEEWIFLIPCEENRSTARVDAKTPSVPLNWQSAAAAQQL